MRPAAPLLLATGSLLLLAAAVPLAPAAPPPAEEGGAPVAGSGLRIAITLDDLPWVGPVPPEGRARANLRLLDTLRTRGVPATGFVTCDRLDPDERILQAWLAAGMELGNHQAAHDDLNKVPEATWLEGVGRCDTALRAATGQAPRFFRYPYLFQGPTPEVRDRVAAALTGTWGYTLAHVSVDNHEWKFADLYGKARKAGDEARAEAITAAYLAHLTGAVQHFREVATRKVGRDVAHVLLLHDNWLAADHLGDVLTALEGMGATFIPLGDALADPVYSLPNAYDGRWGISWLYRIAPPDPESPWMDAEWQRLEDAFAPAAR